MDLQRIRVAEDGTHHVLDGLPLYPQRYEWVLKYHLPGLAAAENGSGAFHIDLSGRPAYDGRFVRTFGFYDDKAAVQTEAGWGHVDPSGSLVYLPSFAWVGNYEEGRCPVRTQDGLYHHVLADGSPAYPERYRYAGDYRDGVACVQREDGLYTHVGRDGRPLHGRAFLDLDVFHKGYARARDAGGWHHVNRLGRAAYERRFVAVEPFYNGQARVEDEDGGLLVIDEKGETVLQLRPPRRTAFRSLSADLVGYWRTQTIRAAVELGVFEALPGDAETIATRTGLAQDRLTRLLRALCELKLIGRDPSGQWNADDRGALLRLDTPISLAAAARMWGEEHYLAWTRLAECLRTGVPGFRATTGEDWFEWLAQSPDKRRGYHEAMTAYARHDYADLARFVDFGSHRVLLDAGGGAGALLAMILEAHPSLHGVLFDRSDVIGDATLPAPFKDRCSLIGGDLFGPWPVKADAVLLARVLHDWPDEQALTILRSARDALLPDGRLYVLEMVLGEDDRGGLLDLNMLVMTGGRERSLEEFQRLFVESRLRFFAKQKLPSGVTVLTGELQ